MAPRSRAARGSRTSNCSCPGAKSPDVALAFDGRRHGIRRTVPVILEAGREVVDPLPDPHGPAPGVEGLQDQAMALPSDEDLLARKPEFLRQTNRLAPSVREELGARGPREPGT